MVCVAVLTMAPMAGSFELDRPLEVQGNALDYQYDDGVAYWLMWDGTYKATWFHFADFGPTGPRYMGQFEYWFYHHSSYPWDTSAFHAELCSGDGGGPIEVMDSESMTALHYSPTYVTLGPLVCVSGCWAVANTNLSSGGWPSLIGDNSPQSTYGSRSFHSNDRLVWTPWIKQGPQANDLFIRAEPLTSLESSTWGAIKALYP